MSQAKLQHHQENKKIFRQRFWLIIWIPILLIIALIARFINLQIISHEQYITLSNKNLLAELPLGPKRGLIYDRNGVLLAGNQSSYRLMVTPDRVPNIKKTMSLLQKIIHIKDSDLKTFYLRTKQHRPFQSIPIKYQLTPNEIAIFYNNQYLLPGLNIQEHTSRIYPFGPIMAPVLGYVARINHRDLASINPINYSATNMIGKRGIEKYYENQLHGQVGNEEMEINANGHVVREIKRTSPIAGSNLTLTIDSHLQQVAYNALGKNNGSIVAINPQSGEVLILVSKPSYNPNLFVNGISQKNYQALIKSPSHPLFNRAVDGLFPPASTIKPFYAIGSLDKKIITAKTKFFDPGWFRLPNTTHTFRDWKYKGHGWVNVSKAIMVSCDTFFYNLASLTNIDTLNDILHPFGFGQTTGIDLPNERHGLTPDKQWKKIHTGKRWYQGDTIVSGIGQGFISVTPLQLAYSTAIIATQGKGYQPHLLLQSGKEKPITPTLKNKIILNDSSSWTIVINAMKNVIRNPIGTGIHFGRHPNYTVAGKTGTAQLYGKKRDEESAQLNIPWRLRNNHLFISFAPINHPQIALAVVVEHSAQAARVARIINDAYFNEPKHAAMQLKIEEKKEKQNTHVQYQAKQHWWSFLKKH